MLVDKFTFQFTSRGWLTVVIALGAAGRLSHKPEKRPQGHSLKYIFCSKVVIAVGTPFTSLIRMSHFVFLASNRFQLALMADFSDQPLPHYQTNTFQIFRPPNWSEISDHFAVN